LERGGQVRGARPALEYRAALHAVLYGGVEIALRLLVEAIHGESERARSGEFERHDGLGHGFVLRSAPSYFRVLRRKRRDVFGPYIGACGENVRCICRIKIEFADCAKNPGSFLMGSQ
jgi:hypothetical protein